MLVKFALMMNNLDKIVNFFNDRTNNDLIVNSLDDQVDAFYLHVLKYFAEKEALEIKIDPEKKNISFDLFNNSKVYLFKKIGSKEIKEITKLNCKKIYFTNYQNFKTHISDFKINAYSFKDDIKIYIKKHLNINNQNLLNFITNSPWSIYSEISKFKVNENYKNNFSFYEQQDLKELRTSYFKELYASNKDLLRIYNLLKEEVSLKRFSFLTS